MDMHRKLRCRRVLRGLAVWALFVSTPAFAELQNVEVAGKIRIRGNYYSSAWESKIAPSAVGPRLRWPAFWLPQRPIGDFVGGQFIFSFWDWDDRGGDYKLVEQRTTLNITADFTQNVSAFMELESYDVWGTDFRSNYVTGVDNRGGTGVEMYQAYIQADEMWGLPLRLRIGRQEIVLGSGWLVGNNSKLPEFPGLSFDGKRLTYATDAFSIDAFGAQLVETGVTEEDGDVWFYGLYGSYYGLENMVFDAYWLWLRDARSLNDTNFGWFAEWVEDWLGIDNYDTTNIHTVGLRAAGTFSGFDYNAELAYQFGDAGQQGFLFKPFLYGDDDADFDEWAGDIEVGYTFDINWQPRVYLGAAYIGGEDNRDISFWDWLNPFDQPQASVSFNRLFSDKVYSYFLDDMASMTNFWSVRGGISVAPTESVEAGLDVSYFEALESFDFPVHFKLGNFIVPIAPNLSFWTTEGPDDLGVETHLWIRYHYTEDLQFSAGWAHFFTGDGAADGVYSDWNGYQFTGGTDDQDADYFYLESILEF